MAKSSTRFVCSSCGFESGKWYGKCPECGTWNSFEEVSVPEPTPRAGSIISGKQKTSYTKDFLEKQAQKIAHIKSFSQGRISTGFEEFDRVLGGPAKQGSMGIVSG